MKIAPKLHAKITASIALLDLHQHITSAAPLSAVVKDSGFVWTKQGQI